MDRDLLLEEENTLKYNDWTGIYEYKELFIEQLTVEEEAYIFNLIENSNKEKLFNIICKLVLTRKQARATNKRLIMEIQSELKSKNKEIQNLKFIRGSENEELYWQQLKKDGLDW